jgi:hypothetical protein
MSYSRRQLYAMGETFGDSATRMEAGGRIVYGGGGGGAPAPQPSTRITESGPTTTNRTTVNEIPQYLTNASQDLVARGQALTSRPYEAYTGARVAEFTPDMQAAFQRMRDQKVAPQTGEATGLASLAGKRAMDYGMFGEGVQQYMNPYMQNVVDIERRKAQEASDQQAAALSGQAVRQGAFGGSGAALQQRALRRDTAQQLGDIQAQGLNRAYESAVNQYNQGISSGLAASQQLGGLGQQQFGQEMDITKGLGTSGDVQRQREQALLDVKYGDYLTAQKYPYEQLAFQQGLVSGVPYSTTARTREVSQPGKQVSQLVEAKEQPNPASQLLGTGLAVYGATGDKAKGGEVKRYAVGGIASLNQPEMASAVQGMDDQQVGNTAAMPGLPGLTAGGEMERRRDLRMAAEGQQAPASMTKITSVLSQMSDAELQQYAKLHKSDPYTMALVVSEANRRKEGGMPTQEQPKVVDQQIASMALPEDQGIAQLPVGNMEFAEGGIVAFQSRGEVPEPEEATSLAGDFFRGIGNLIRIDPKLASLRDRQAAAQRGIFEALTPTEVKAREEELRIVEQEIAALKGGAPAPMAEGIGALIMNDEARKRAPGQAAAAAQAAQAAAAQGAGPAPAPTGAGGAGGAGIAGGYSDILRQMELGNKARTDAEKEAIGIEDAAMAKERTAQETAIEDAKKYGSDREERLKKREEGMKGAEERNINTTFIEAGLAIMAGESSNALLNIAKGARQGLKGYEERLEKINANKEKLDDDFSRLYELRQEKVGAAGEKLRQIDKEIAGLKAGAKRTFGQLASDLAGQKINVGMKQLEAAESRFNAGISSNTPNNQLFADLVAKNKGDKVAAYKQYSAMTSKGDGGLPPGADKYLDELFKKKAEIVSSQFSLPDQQNALARIDKEIQSVTGRGGASSGKITTMAEIRAVAAKRGVPEQQIMDAAKAKGYIIQ